MRRPARRTPLRPLLSLAWHQAARQRVGDLLAVLAVAIAVATMLTGVLCARSITPSFVAQQRALGAPDLLVSAAGLTADGGLDLARSVSGVDQVARAGPVWRRSEGAVTSVDGTRQLPAALVAGLPDWAASSTSQPPPSSQVLLERGFAAELHAVAGSTVRVTGPSGSVDAVVAGTAADLSTNSYPLTPVGSVFAGSEVAQQVGIGTAGEAVLGVWTDDDLGTVADRVSAALRTADVSVSVTALSNSVSGLGLVTTLTTGMVLVFGVAATFCLLVFLVSGIRLRILRGERQLGQQLAIGLTGGQIRLVLVAERLPAVLLGAAVGSALGWFGAHRLTGEITALFGAPARVEGFVPAVVVTFVAVVAAVLATTLLLTRRLGRLLPARLLRQEHYAGSTRHGLRTVAGPARVGVALARARPGRTALVVVMSSLAVATGAFAVVSASTMAYATRTPAIWGYAYDLRVDVASADAAEVARQAAQLDGVTAAVVDVASTVRVGPGEVSSPVELLPVGQQVRTPRLLKGTLPTAAGQVALGSSLAEAAHVGVGDRVVLASRTSRTVDVVGVVDQVGGSGLLVVGTPELADVVSARQSAAVLVRAQAGSDLAALAGQLAGLDGGSVAVTTAKEQIAFPFARSLRQVLVVLASALTLLAGVVAVSAAVTTGAEQLRTFSLVRSLGASAGQRLAIAGGYASSIALPVALLGVGLTALLTAGALQAVTTQLLHVDPRYPWPQLGAVAFGIWVLVSVSALWPAAAAARRAPVRGLRGPA